MKKIDDVRAYAAALQEKTPVLFAKKKTCVIARIGREGEEIATYVSNGLLETVSRVKRDETGRLGVVVSAADPAGNKTKDANGRPNTYIVERKTFDEKYRDAETVSETERLFYPRGGAQKFIQIFEDISITAPWGEEERLKAGSFLNVTDPEKIYGVAYEEFLQTYAFTDPQA